MKKAAFAVSSLALLVAGTSAVATVNLMNEYMFTKRIPQATCRTCHVQKLPKQGEPPDLNDLGKKVVKARRPNGSIDWAKVPNP